MTAVSLFSAVSVRRRVPIGAGDASSLLTGYGSEGDHSPLPTTEVRTGRASPPLPSTSRHV
jgi:hypothetical protein